MPTLNAAMQPSVLFLIDALERPGGTETHLLELTKRLPSEGYTPIVCNLAGDQPVLKLIADSGVETWPVTVHRLYAPAGRAVVRDVISRAAGRGVAAIHTFHFKSDWMGVSVARALKCPLVSSRRDLGFAQTPLRRLALRFIDPQVKAFIAPSRAVQTAVHEREGVATERIRVIYNGLDPARFSERGDRAEMRRDLGVPNDAAAIVMVGNLRPVKDHTTLIKAMGPVAAAHPNSHLVLVGEGTEMDRLSGLADSMGIRDHVTFAGARKDVARILAAMDVFVLSTHSEGMSNAIIEAMAAGLPVVATDVGGNAECVLEGVTGYIVPHENVEALAHRLGGLLADSVSAKAMGAAGRDRVAEEFDVQAMVRRTADLYRNLTAAGRRNDAS
jgi:glycosyltransferase involved in cell wall biosynthesis